MKVFFFLSVLNLFLMLRYKVRSMTIGLNDDGVETLIMQYNTIKSNDTSQFSLQSGPQDTSKRMGEINLFAPYIYIKGLSTQKNKKIQNCCGNLSLLNGDGAVTETFSTFHCGDNCENVDTYLFFEKSDFYNASTIRWFEDKTMSFNFTCDIDEKKRVYFSQLFKFYPQGLGNGVRLIQHPRMYSALCVESDCSEGFWNPFHETQYMFQVTPNSKLNGKALPDDLRNCPVKRFETPKSAVKDKFWRWEIKRLFSPNT